MSSAQVGCEIRGPIAWITLDRPTALNALSFEMLHELLELMPRCARDPAIRAVLLQGAGDRAFCAGGDIRALYHSFKQGESLHRNFFVAEYTLDFMLHTFPKPIIALIDGITMGGGMGLAQASRLRIVGDRTRMAMPEVGIGLFPDVGASYFLSRTPGALGRYLALTGTQIQGADAIYAGLADVYVAEDEKDALMKDLGRIAFTADVEGDLRRTIHARAAMGLPAPSLSVLRSAIDQHFAHSSVQGIIAALDAEGRPAFLDWAQHTAKLMRTRSPTLLAVTLKQLERGRSLSLADCFRMELNMVEHALDHGDFMEGIRALLIDKDNAPAWMPSRLDDVTDAAVDAFFKERWTRRDHPLVDLHEVR